MVRLANVKVDSTGIDAQVEGAVQTELARGGTIDPGFRSRVRAQFLRLRQLDEVTRTRAGRDKPSARQVKAVKERDARRAERAKRGNISREVLAKRGLLAGSRGQEGVTRTPSRISGNTIQSGDSGAGDFRARPRSEFGGRRAILRQSTPTRKRLSREETAQADGKVTKTAELITVSRQAAPVALDVPKLQPTKRRIGSTGIVSQAGVLTVSGQREGLEDRAARFVQEKTGVNVPAFVRRRKEASIKGDLVLKPLADKLGLKKAEKAAERFGERKLKEATTKSGVLQTIGLPTSQGPVAQAFAAFEISGKLSALREKPTKTLAQAPLEGAALATGFGVLGKTTASSQTARILFGNPKVQTAIKVVEGGVASAVVALDAVKARKESKKRGENILKSFSRETTDDLAFVGGFAATREAGRVILPRVTRGVSSVDRLQLSVEAGAREARQIKAGVAPVVARKERVAIETLADDFVANIRSDKKRSFRESEFQPSALQGEERIAFTEFGLRRRLVAFGSRNIAAQGGRISRFSDVDVAVPTFRTGRTRSQVIREGTRELQEASQFKGIFERQKSSIVRRGELVADIKKGSTFARREFGTRLGKAKGSDRRFAKAEEEGLRNLLRATREDDVAKGFSNALEAARVSRRRVKGRRSKKTESERVLEGVLRRESPKVDPRSGQLRSPLKPRKLKVAPLLFSRVKPPQAKASVFQAPKAKSSAIVTRGKSSDLFGSTSGSVFRVTGSSSGITSSKGSSIGKGRGSSSLFRGEPSSRLRGGRTPSVFGGFADIPKGKGLGPSTRQRFKRRSSLAGLLLAEQGVKVAQGPFDTGFGIRQVRPKKPKNRKKKKKGKKR